MAAKEEWALLEACELKARLGDGDELEAREREWSRSARQIQTLVDLLEKSRFPQ
jgi:hypothetical protein